MNNDYFDEDEIQIIRRAYARQMLALGGCLDNRRLEQAFATVRREDFIGPAPWSIARGAHYETLRSSDPALLYQDILIALAPARGANNGSPSLHARWLSAVEPRPGEHVAHLGAGTGYYTAILAELVGQTGSVDGAEIDASLVARAKACLSTWPQVTVNHGDALSLAGRLYDCIYVNFAVEHPVRIWTDALAEGGRIIFPLGVSSPSRGKPGVRHTIQGAAFIVTRRPAGLAVRWMGGASFVCAYVKRAAKPLGIDSDRRSEEAEPNSCAACIGQ